jgi:hypothetical protein
MIDADARARLPTRLREEVQEHLAQPLHDLLDELDAHLFDLAGRSRTSAQQQVYFDALRVLRSDRVQLETGFLEGADILLVSDDASSRAGHPSGPLRLVEKDEQEETLTLESLVQRLSERLARPLEVLLARLAALSGEDADDSPQDSAISPRGLSRLFRQAIQPLGLHIEIRLIAFGLFGQHVLRALPSLYSRLNRILAEGGILPDISETEPSAQQRAIRSARRSARHRIPEPGAPPAVEPPPAAPPPGTVPDGYDARLGELHRLLRARSIAASEAATDPALTEEPLSVGSLDLALDRLWTFEEDPLVFKAHLVASARRVSGQGAAVLCSEHEDIVDLISLLFARVRSDPNIPMPMQRLLSRLHVPFLRTALADPALLHAESHPARELLDELALAAIGWCPSADPGEALIKQIAVIVENLASHHASGQPIEFAGAIAALRQFEDAHRRRADIAEQRAIETVLGRERLALARNRVATLLEHQIERQNPIPWVRQLLRGPWSNHLALLWLRHGETSAGFHAATALVEELLWADDPSALRTDPVRLARARESLPEQLRQGLAGVTLYESEIQSLVARLQEYLDIQMRGEDVPDVMYEADPSLAQTDFSAQWRETLTDEHAGRPDPGADLLAHARSLPIGTWVQFHSARGDDSEIERGKLCWTSPYTGHGLFVNRNGVRLREASPEALAIELKSGDAFVIDHGRLLERTLRSLVEELQHAYELPGRLREG